LLVLQPFWRLKQQPIDGLSRLAHGAVELPAAAPLAAVLLLVLMTLLLALMALLLLTLLQLPLVLGPVLEPAPAVEAALGLKRMGRGLQHHAAA
jgi:hypothetical protein